MLVIAHRGASAYVPENRPEAFELADHLGADGVELDVRWVRRRGEPPRLVVEHDPLPDDPEAVDRLPDLSDVLDACGDRMLVNVEIKYGRSARTVDPSMAVVDATVELLRARPGRHLDRWLISSFSGEAVGRVRAIAPELRSALLVERFDDGTIDSATRARHSAIHPDVDTIDAELVHAAHDRGLLVTGWTCNERERFPALRTMGVDAICTDVPDVALSSLGRSAEDPDPRPRWPWREARRDRRSSAPGGPTAPRG